MGNLDIINLLICNGADVNEKDLKGNTALFHGKLQMKLEIFSF